MSIATLLDEAKRLPAADRLRLIGDLWDTLDDGDLEPELSPEQISVLQERLDRIDREGVSGDEWEVVKARLLAGRQS